MEVTFSSAVDLQRTETCYIRENVTLLLVFFLIFLTFFRLLCVLYEGREPHRSVSTPPVYELRYKFVAAGL
jgi:hypothetical protein